MTEFTSNLGRPTVIDCIFVLLVPFSIPRQKFWAGAMAPLNPPPTSDGPATTLCILTSFFVVIVSLTSRIPSSKLGGRKMLSSLALPQKLVPPMKLEMLRTTMPSGTVHMLCQQKDCVGGFKNKSSFC